MPITRDPAGTPAACLYELHLESGSVAAASRLCWVSHERGERGLSAAMAAVQAAENKKSMAPELCSSLPAHALLTLGP